MSSLESQENKQLLWGILSEEGIFDSIPESVTTDEVKHVFERILKNLSASIPTLLAGRLKELYIEKERAIMEEDYDSAKTIRSTIEQMEAPAARIIKLEQRKQSAIQAEDYDSAKQIKIEIDRMRTMSFSLIELNKIAIQYLVTGIPKITADIIAIKDRANDRGRDRDLDRPDEPSLSQQFQLPQDIYNAEDFKSQKRNELEMKMREKETELRSYFEVKKPAAIDFSDRHNQPPPRLKSSVSSTAQAQARAQALAPAVELVHLDYNGAAAPVPTSTSSANYDGQGSGLDPGSDSPIGDDMDKLIAERIASRERDLSEITQQIKRTVPTAPDQKSNDIMIMRKPAPAPALAPALEHKVRFDETLDIIQDNEPQEPTDINTIFMKLKRKPGGGEV